MAGGHRVLLRIRGMLVEDIPGSARWLWLTLCYTVHRYNMSYIVEQSALNGKAVLGVSINYRLAAFGFLDSEEVRVRLLYTDLDVADSRY